MANDQNDIRDTGRRITRGCLASAYSSSRRGSSDSRAHDEYEIIYAAEGRVSVRVDSRTFELDGGEALFIASGVPHTIDPSGRLSLAHGLYYSVMFRPELVGGKTDPCRRLLSGFPSCVKVKATDTLAENLLGAYNHLNTSEDGSEFAVRMHIFAALYELTRLCGGAGQKKSVPHIGSNISDYILNYITENYRSRITLGEIAESCGYTPNHLSRVFKGSTGDSIVNFLNRYRVDRAARELICTDENIADIAFDNGFDNLSNFNRIFKKYAGFTPSEYRGALKN